MSVWGAIGRVVMRSFTRASLIAMAAPHIAFSQPQCRQALALGLDVSGSVDLQEYRLQLDGVAAALQSPKVVEKLLASKDTFIELSVYEWSGPGHQRLLQGWTAVTSREVITDIANTLRGVERIPVDPSTGLGRAMLYGADALAQRPDCWSHSLDLSGDGQSNSGIHPQDARIDPALDNVVVNALVVGANVPGRDLTAYFEAYVLHGIGSFTMQASNFKEFETAMIKKLLREMQGIVVSYAPPPADQ